MRQIRFRAWDKELKKMLPNIQEYYDNLGWDFYPTGQPNCFGDFLNNDSFVVMQFTGSFDKDGKEIYSGDIIKRANKFTGVVTFDKCGFRVQWEKDATFYDHPRHLDEYLPSNIEVIGNSHENPELLEAQNG